MSDPKLCIIQTYEILAANIIDTNIALEAAWNNAVHYIAGQNVRSSYQPAPLSAPVDGIWQAVKANHDSLPTNDNLDWVYLGPPNRYSCFDIQYGVEKTRITETKTISSGNIEYSISVPIRVTAIAFFGLKAGKIEINAYNEYGYSYSAEYNLALLDPINGNIAKIYFGKRNRETKHIFDGFGIPPNSTIEIVISNFGGGCEVDSIVFGAVDKFGIVSDGSAGTAFSVESRSVIKLDGLFNTFVPRAATSKAQYNVMLWGDKAESFVRAAQSLTGVAAVFYVSNQTGNALSVYGLMQACNMIPLSATITSVVFEVTSL